jgi:hypothetical protein
MLSTHKIETCISNEPCRFREGKTCLIKEVLIEPFTSNCLTRELPPIKPLKKAPKPNLNICKDIEMTGLEFDRPCKKRRKIDGNYYCADKYQHQFIRHTIPKKQREVRGATYWYQCQKEDEI